MVEPVAVEPVAVEPVAVEPVAIDELAAALQLGSHELVSLVGGGGKTTGLFELGRQLAGTVVLTTTTKMGRQRTDGHHVMFSPSDSELADALAQHRTALAWRTDAGQKAIGVDPAVCDRWFDLADHIVVEADGARRMPFTAPNPFEPIVPSRTTMLIVCVGIYAWSVLRPGPIMGLQLDSWNGILELMQVNAFAEKRAPEAE